MEIQDRIRDASARVAALRQQHEREVAHVAKARSDLAKTEELLERCTAARVSHDEDGGDEDEVLQVDYDSGVIFRNTA